jgi:hypothetical protein
MRQALFPDPINRRIAGSAPALSQSAEPSRRARSRPCRSMIGVVRIPHAPSAGAGPSNTPHHRAAIPNLGRPPLLRIPCPNDFRHSTDRVFRVTKYRVETRCRNPVPANIPVSSSDAH